MDGQKRESLRPRRCRRGRKRMTLQEVADLAGVAPITASRAINTPKAVSDRLREKVDAAVRELGYVPNRLAGGLASAGSRVIPVIVPSLSILTFLEIIDGIQQTLEAAGYQTLLGTTGFDLEREAALADAVLGYSPAGVILTGLRHHPDTLRKLRYINSPVVEIMEHGSDCIDLSVGVANPSAGAAMAQHLIDKGHQRIAFMGTRLDEDYRAEQRLIGQYSILKANGLETHRVVREAGDSSYAVGQIGLRRVLDEHPDTTAVHFANDNLAAGAIFEANRLGINIPRELAVGGYLGLSVGEHISPRLTTLAIPRFEMGVHAAQMLLDRVDGQNFEEPRVDIGFDLVVREST